MSMNRTVARTRLTGTTSRTPVEELLHLGHDLQRVTGPIGLASAREFAVYSSRYVLGDVPAHGWADVHRSGSMEHEGRHVDRW
jgi:hypothetical protein